MLRYITVSIPRDDLANKKDTAGVLFRLFIFLFSLGFSYKLDYKQDRRIANDIYGRHYPCRQGSAVKQGSVYVECIRNAEASDKKCADGYICGKSK